MENTLLQQSDMNAGIHAGMETPEVESFAGTGVACNPLLSAAWIVAADALALILAVTVSVLVRHAFGGNYSLSVYGRLWPLLGLFAAVYVLFGLYPGIVVTAVTEIRRISAATTVVFLMLAVITFLFRVADTYSRFVFFGAWILSMLLVPFVRAFVRKRFARRDWWGYAAVVFGAGETGQMVVQSLQAQPELGFRVKVVIDPDARNVTSLYGAPVLRNTEYAASIARQGSISYAIVAMPELPRAKLLALLESHTSAFRNLLIVPDLNGISSLGIETKDLCRQLTLEVRRSLLLPSAQIIKRVVDVALAVMLGALVLPVCLILYFLLKLESRGPALYTQSRLGRGGRTFRIWKFRSMVQDAQRILIEHLERHPELKSEWERDHKLKNDPRITPLGKFLRKTSLDELPQLWNVLKGDMSLVGPRPIVEAEILKYGAGYLLYTQVTPGITGLWQVSGRNDTTYTERVALDSYYVRNWSPWLDVYVLGKTVKVVLAGEGAY